MLYVMRHGQTDWNIAFKMQGRTDIKLNETGRKTAKKAAEENTVHFDVCYCSPLARAKETAEIFFENTGVPVIPDDRLTEMGFGGHEGVCFDRKDPSTPIYDFFVHPEEYVPTEGAESFESLYARTLNFIEEVVNPLLAEGKNVLIAGHCAMNCSIINQIRGIELKDFWQSKQENCQLVKVI